MSIIDKPSQFVNEPISLMDIPRLEKEVYKPLNPKYIKVLRLSSIAPITLLLVATIIVSIVRNDIPFWITLCICSALLLFGIVHQMLMRKIYRFRGYLFRNKDVSYRTGIFMPKEKSVPYSKLQHVVLSQHLYDRPFGLYRLSLFNAAGGVEEDLVIAGLEKEEAEAYKEWIIEQISDVEPSKK
ncbi:MAG: PH domain-containing protein [Porphyromonas sp.]|nr:PH domain-containing protein [Porphyromonas sp.]